MKNIIKSKDEKITDKAFSQSLLISVLSILLCIVALCSITYAWFSEEALTSNNTMTAGKFYLDATVTYTESGDTAEKTVDVVKLTDGSMSCTLANKNTTYKIVLSMTEETNVKGYCAISINGGEKQITEPISNDSEIGVKTLSFTITTAEDNTTVSLTPVWGYPANPTVTDGTSIVLGGSAEEEDRKI